MASDVREYNRAFELHSHWLIAILAVLRNEFVNLKEYYVVDHVSP